MRKVIIFTAAIVLTGCFSLPEVEREARVIEDDFERYIRIVGIGNTSRPGPISKAQYFLRSFTSKTKKGDTEHQLYVTATYSGENWHYYNRALLKGGETLEFIDISSDVDCGGYECTYTKEMVAVIPSDYLQEHSGGFDVKISSKSGNEFVISVTSEQVSKQIEKLESL